MIEVKELVMSIKDDAEMKLKGSGECFKVGLQKPKILLDLLAPEVIDCTDGALLEDWVAAAAAPIPVTVVLVAVAVLDVEAAARAPAVWLPSITVFPPLVTFVVPLCPDAHSAKLG
jgi:hypothetical protein